MTTEMISNGVLRYSHSLYYQLLLFATSNDSEKVIPIFQEAAKDFKGKVINRYPYFYLGPTYIIDSGVLNKEDEAELSNWRIKSFPLSVQLNKEEVLQEIENLLKFTANDYKCCNLHIVIANVYVLV